MSSADCTKIPNSLQELWMPFTSNKDFKDTFPINEFSDGGVVKANMKGILRATANNQYKRELDVLRYLENEAFPDANKIERSQNKLFSIKKVIDVLDRDMIHDNFIDKSKNQLDFIKAKMSGLFETEKKREELTVWAGFSPEQLEAIKGENTKVLAHKEKE